MISKTKDLFSPKKTSKDPKPKVKAKTPNKAENSSEKKKPIEKKEPKENETNSNVENLEKTKKFSKANKKCLFIALLLGAVVLCASIIGIVFSLKPDETPPDVKIETVNNITVNIKKGGPAGDRPAYKKIIKNGKEYFVMTKKTGNLSLNVLSTYYLVLSKSKIRKGRNFMPKK